jgi:hypothetical protein
MNGYQVTFFTRQDHRHRHQPIKEWSRERAKSPGIAGSTSSAVEHGSVSAGKRKP